MSEVTAYIALGSNLGHRLDHLHAAALALAAHPQIRLTGHSGIYETAPVGGPVGQGAFLNAVLEVKTSLTANELLRLMQSIEDQQGRQRIEHWGPRTLDLDLLIFGAEIVLAPDLTIPHPRLTERNFVLAPFCDLAPDLIIPGTSQTVKEMYRRVGDEGLAITPYTF